MNRPSPASTWRAWNIVLACAAAVAMVGFFTGTHDTPVPGGYRPAARPTPAVGVAPRARDMERVRYAARHLQQEAALTAMAAPPRSPMDAVTLSAQAYDDAVDARRPGRAYDGAPPTIPHAVDQRGTPACLGCHERGMTVEGKVAKVVSHTSFPSCLQCHATREAGPPLAPLPDSFDTGSSFAGLPSPGRGERAWPGAPPQMPHRSFMRERCASCHGLWATGLASSHPYRQNCRQCHEPEASADQAPRSTFAPVGSLEGVR